MPKQLRMAHKLWLAVILIVVMLVAVVGFAAYRSAKVQAQADAVSKEMEARGAITHHRAPRERITRERTTPISLKPSIQNLNQSP